MTASHRDKLEAELTLAVASARHIDVLLPMMDVFNAGESITLEAQGLRRALGRLLADEALGRVWLIQVQAETVGYVVLTFGYDLEFAGSDGFITELFLRPDARGRGFGRLALAKVEAAAADLGVQAIHLMVRPENQAAVALYAAAGYTSPPRVFLSKTLARK
jgi:ribosomal protein S18 acetylase RimI-like enzyme